VGVDAFLIANLDLKRGNAQVIAQKQSGLAGEVLNECRMLIGLHGDVALVFAFEQWVDRDAARMLNLFKNLLWSNDVGSFRHLDAHGIPSALDVSSVIADGAATRALGSERNAQFTTHDVASFALLVMPNGSNALPCEQPALLGENG